MTATVVVNVKTPTDEVIATTKDYIQRVKDFIDLQDELEVNTFQNNLISWLENQNWVEKVNFTYENDMTANASPHKTKRNILNPGEEVELIDIKFVNSAHFTILFYDLSLSDAGEYEGNLNLSSYFKPFAIDVSSIDNEEIIDNPNVLYIQGRTMISFKRQNESTANKENDRIQTAIHFSPINFNITPVFKDISFLGMDMYDYGMILLGQTHGCYEPYSSNTLLTGAFEVEDQYVENSLNCGITLAINDKTIEKDEFEPVYMVSPRELKKCNIKDGTIFYGNYCYSYYMQDYFPNTTYFGYSSLAKYVRCSVDMTEFFDNMSLGMTYEKAIERIIEPYFYKSGGVMRKALPTTNYRHSRQRYFSISTDELIEYSDTGNPIIKAQINGYNKLKSDIYYYAYIYKKSENLDFTDIIANGKLINKAANNGKGINDDGTFSFEYPDLTITRPSDYNVVIGFNYFGITYYGPIKTLMSLCPDSRHPHMIDLGLPSGIKWACCNVDTEHPENQSPTNFGGYYAWGETEVKPQYNYDNYDHCTVCFESNGDRIVTYHDVDKDCKDIAGTNYDVAHMKWGDNWMIPSSERIDELIYNCPSEFTTVNGVSGIIATGKNGCCIFLPTAGYRSDDLHFTENGFYWSSDIDLHSDVSILHFGTPKYNPLDFLLGARPFGLSVRPIWVP